MKRTRRSISDISKLKLALSLACGVALIFLLAGCGRSQEEKNNQEIKEAMLGKWESLDKAYILEVEQDQRLTITQSLYNNGKLVQQNNVYRDDYGYANEHLDMSYGNAYYLLYAGEMTAFAPFYIDGDKLLFEYEGEWIRFNKVTESGAAAGHSDLYIDMRLKIIGFWASKDRDFFPNFMNGDGNGKFILWLPKGTEDGQSESESEYFEITDIVPASDLPDVDARGLDYIIVTQKVDEMGNIVDGETIYYPMSCDDDTLTIVYDGAIKECECLLHGY
ncbi:hypothetical protein [Butyrivibrio proteoclasticus]|uniref:hypothetical protein n=1 Tax=Butyrivibrio proteoclasticus TaxID=43305 RepID=UPI00047E7456|nr:hypothetical protein [Butyrivibrio proteoclasticus]